MTRGRPRSRGLFLGVMLAAGASCAAPTDELPVLFPAPPLPGEARVVDLSPSPRPVPRPDQGGEGASAAEGAARVHALDVAALDVARLIGPAAVIDLPVGEDVVRVEHLLDWEARHGALPSGSIVLLRTGARSAPEGEPLRPGWSVEAARFLVEERAISGAGIDRPTFDPGAAGEPLARRALVASGRFVVEGLLGLDALPSSGGTAIVLPLAGPGESVGAARAIALLPR